MGKGVDGPAGAELAGVGPAGTIPAGAGPAGAGPAGCYRGPAMTRFVLRRLLHAAVTLVGITVLAFVLMRSAPGDPLTLMLADSSDLTVEDLAALRAANGLDRPVAEQYLQWAGRLLRGDLGQSLLYGRPVREMILAVLPNTLLLSGLALLLALLVGVPLGLAAAWRRGSWLDHLIRVTSVVGHAVPSFWFGLLIILVLAVGARLLPVGGMLSIGASPWDVADRLLHLVGPVVTLSLPGIASYTRYLRTEALEVLGQEYVRTARAKGLPLRAILSVHVLRNALLPVVTSLGGALATIVSGTLVVEQVFAWPGMGRLTFDAARGKDYPVVMGVVVISATVLLLGYLARDLAYALVDPRVRRS